MQYMLRYTIQMVYRETCHICWFEKIISHVVILNFSMKIQSTDASIFVSVLHGSEYNNVSMIIVCTTREV
jgi:hypothetical protein